jgi:hypothetical protein
VRNRRGEELVGHIFEIRAIAIQRDGSDGRLGPQGERAGNQNQDRQDSDTQGKCRTHGVVSLLVAGFYLREAADYHEGHLKNKEILYFSQCRLLYLCETTPPASTSKNTL